jgi:phosphoribosylaminoimidazolecarboxamide formyltransferase/IMP cyclohydrolase
MTDQNNPGLRKIRRALISVSDKTGIVDFARELNAFAGRDYQYRRHGQDAARGRHRSHRRFTGHRLSRDDGWPRQDFASEDSRRACLVCATIPAHLEAMREHSIEPIDMVVVNLYPFEQTVMGGATMDEAIEQIDIGGPAMIRSAGEEFSRRRRDRFELPSAGNRRGTEEPRWSVERNRRV